MDENSFYIENIVLAHRFYANPQWVSYEYVKARPRHGLVYVLDGSAVYEMNDGSVITAQKDDLLYMPEGTLYLTRSQDEGFLHLTINFKMRGSITLPRHRHCAENERTRRDMLRLVSEWSHRDQFYREKCIGMLYLLLCSQLEICQHNVPIAAEKIRNAIQALNFENNPSPSVASLAASCEMSEQYFRRLFQQVYGISPLNYMTQRRIGYACDLLQSTNISVEQVCFASGYQDPAYFSRIFKKVTGLSPSSYRSRSITES